MSKANRSGRAPTPGTAGGQAGVATRRLNVKALLILASAVAVAVPGFFAVRAFQARASRSTYLDQARAAVDAGRDDLALQYINAYLQIDPRNLDALDLKGKVLARSARDASALEEAIRAENLILSIAPDRMDARKRLIELNLRAGLFRPAQVAAEEYLRRGADDAEAHRLLARALEGAGYLGDSSALDRAIVEYEKAESLRPGDVGGASRLAALYRSKGKDPARAQGVMDSLLKHNPNSPAVRLARFRFFLGDPDVARALPRAMAEIDEALKAAPGDLDARLVAAEFAAQKGDAAGARKHLDAIDPKPADDLRISLVRGMVELVERRTEDAIQSWRSGLIQTGGTDVDLTWRLARVLLEMGRVRDAEPLMAQYRRLTGGSEPRPEYRYLVALMYLRQGRAADAVSELEAIRDKIDGNLAAQHLTALGRAYELARDEPKALDAYRRATAAPGAGPQPWLAMARLQIADRPDAAVESLERGLAVLPEESRLLATLAQVLLRREVAKPKDRREWAEFLRVLGRAEAAAPTSAEVAAAKADYLSEIGRPDDGLKLLADATAKAPTSASLWVARAAALAQLGRADEALDVLATATKAAGEDASFRIARASILLRRGEARAARAALVEGIDRVPRDGLPALWRALGELYQGQSDPVNARHAYEEWSRLAPDAPEPRLALLNLAITSGDVPAMEAQVEAMKAAGGPGGLYWKIARAEVLLRPGAGPAGGPDAVAAEKARLDEAAGLIREIKAALDRQPTGPILEGRLREREGKADAAVAAYQAALDLKGGQAALRPLVVLLTKERRAADLDALRKKVAAFPPDLDRLSGALALQMGDADQAEALARRMVEGDPQSLDAAVWQARVLNSLGKAAQAEESLRALTRRRPDDPSAWLQLLMFQVGRKDMAAARATVEAMRGVVKAERPEALWATCYRVIGARDDADDQYRKALAKWPDDPKLRRAAADYYESTGRPDLALPSLRHSLKIVPGSDWARRRLALNLSGRPDDRGAMDEALALVGDAPRGDESPDDRLTRATVLSRSPEPARRDEAIRILESLASEIPNSSNLHEALARSLLATGRRPAAREHAARAAGAADAGADAILLHATLAIQDRDVAEADRQLARLIAIDPEALPTVELNARVLHAKGDDAGAVALVRRALEAREGAPDRLAVGVGMLRLLLALGLPDAATEVGREVAKLGPRGQIALAELLGPRGPSRDEAAALLGQAAKAGLAADAIRSALAMASDGRAPEWLDVADALLAPALAARPDAIDLLQARAYLKHLGGDYSAEIKTYEQILALKPDNVIFMNNMAWTLSEEMGRPEEGLAAIDRAIAKVGRQTHMLDTRGVILLRLGRVDAAVADLEAAAAGLASPAVYYHLARAYEKAGRAADLEKTRALAREAGLSAGRLQPSERAEAARLIGLADEGRDPKVP